MSVWSEEGGRWPRVWRKNGCGFLFGVVGCEQWDARSRVWALGWRRQEGASDAARQAGSSRSLDLDGRQAVCALALEGRGLAFGSEGRRRRGSSGKGG